MPLTRLRERHAIVALLMIFQFYCRTFLVLGGLPDLPATPETHSPSHGAPLWQRLTDRCGRWMAKTPASTPRFGAGSMVLDDAMYFLRF
jgi:hypothetical protein